MNSQRFKQFLVTAEQYYPPDYQLTRMFARSLLTRIELWEEDHTQPGLTIETLACDIVNYMGYIEHRLLPKE